MSCKLCGARLIYRHECASADDNRCENFMSAAKHRQRTAKIARKLQALQVTIQPPLPDECRGKPTLTLDRLRTTPEQIDQVCALLQDEKERTLALFRFLEEKQCR